MPLLEQQLTDVQNDLAAQESEVKELTNQVRCTNRYVAADTLSGLCDNPLLLFDNARGWTGSPLVNTPLCSTSGMINFEIWIDAQKQQFLCCPHRGDSCRLTSKVAHVAVHL